MFGIGLPEFILIMALALIVVGPDKLPDLARSVAKGILELKKTANTLKESLNEEGNPLDEIKPELEEAARSLQDQVLDHATQTWQDSESQENDDNHADADTATPIIDVEAEKVEEQSVPAEEQGQDSKKGKKEEDPRVAEIRKNLEESEHQS